MKRERVRKYLITEFFFFHSKTKKKHFFSPRNREVALGSNAHRFARRRARGFPFFFLDFYCYIFFFRCCCCCCCCCCCFSTGLGSTGRRSIIVVSHFAFSLSLSLFLGEMESKRNHFLFSNDQRSGAFFFYEQGPDLWSSWMYFSFSFFIFLPFFLLCLQRRRNGSSEIRVKLRAFLRGKSGYRSVFQYFFFAVNNSSAFQSTTVPTKGETEGQGESEGRNWQPWKKMHKHQTKETAHRTGFNIFGNICSSNFQTR